MAARRTITVSITPDQDGLVRACLQSGRYASTSEVIRAALRLLHRQESEPPLRVRREAVAGKVTGHD